MSDFKPLSDLVFNVTDKVAGKKDSAKPYVGLEHMPSGGSSLLGFGRASDSISTNNVFRPGDTLFGKLRPQLRKSVQVSFDGYCSTDILVLRASNGANADFAAKIIQSECVFGQAIRTEEGTKMPRTSWRAIKDVPVLLPPLPQQRKIARFLTTVDNLIEKTEALIAKYQAIKQGMMHDLFTRGVDEHGHLRPPYEEAPELYKPSELSWIPKEWDVCSGESLADLITKGESPTWQGFDYQDDGVLFVTSENVREGFMDVSTPKFIPEAFDSKLYRSRLAHGDVLINLVGASIGRSCRVPDSIGRANINQAVCLFRAKSVVLSNWIAYYFQLPEVMTRLTGEQVETARANVSLTDVREFKFPVPSDDEMRQVIRSLGTADKAALSERAILVGLGKQKTGLMQDLLTGRVRVKVDEAEEVAAHA